MPVDTIAVDNNIIAREQEVCQRDAAKGHLLLERYLSLFEHFLNRHLNARVRFWCKLGRPDALTPYAGGSAVGAVFDVSVVLKFCATPLARVYRHLFALYKQGGPQWLAALVSRQHPFGPLGAKVMRTPLFGFDCLDYEQYTTNSRAVKRWVDLTGGVPELVE